MAQERFEKTSAKRALDLYRSFILNESLKDKIANSNRTLVILTIISYFGDCTKTKLKKAIPVASFDATIDELISLGYITKRREGMEVHYSIGHSDDFSRETSEVSDETCFLFANTLMNISTYIKTYKITSWNIFSFMLEIAWKMEGSSVHLDEKSIESIKGLYANKMSTRKQLERMGIIKNIHPDSSGRSSGSDFRVNKEAYIIEVK